MSVADTLILAFTVCTIVGSLIVIVLSIRLLIQQRREAKRQTEANLDISQQLQQFALLQAETLRLERESLGILTFVAAYKQAQTAVRQGEVDRYDGQAAVETALGQLLQAFALDSPDRPLIVETIARIRSQDDYGL